MNDYIQISPNIPPYIQKRINERCLNNAFDDYQATINLYDRNGHFTIAHEITTKGIAQQEDILNYLEKNGALSPMADYYFMNWPKSLRLLLCELSEDHNVILEIEEAQLCSCPE